MKKLIILASVLVLMAGIASTARALTLGSQNTVTTSQFTGFAEGTDYTWGPDSLQLPTGSKIISATVTFNGLYSNYDPNLFTVYLLQNTPSGIYSWYDMSEWGSNVSLGSYIDPYPNNSQYTVNRVFTIPSTNYAWLNSGDFGFGVVPDCHWYDSSVVLSVTTSSSSVPEPTTAILLYCGLIGLVAFRKRIKEA
jgi:hypothetical protein